MSDRPDSHLPCQTPSQQTAPPPPGRPTAYLEGVDLFDGLAADAEWAGEVIRVGVVHVDARPPLLPAPARRLVDDLLLEPRLDHLLQLIHVPAANDSQLIALHREKKNFFRNDPTRLTIDVLCGIPFEITGGGVTKTSAGVAYLEAVLT